MKQVKEKHSVYKKSASLFWPEVVAPDWVLSMGQIELNCVLLLNLIVWNKTDHMYKNGFGIKQPTTLKMP